MRPSNGSQSHRAVPSKKAPFSSNWSEPMSIVNARSARAVAAMLVLTACAPTFSVPAPQPADAVAAQSTDLYLYRFGQGARDTRVFNITNRIGYDNQPAWDGNTRLLYTSQARGQTDINEIDFSSDIHRKLTDTPES